IGIIPGQIMTKSLTLPIKAVNGFVAPDPERDILKLAVIERHRASGSMSVGFVSGIGLKRGAMAGTVAHDSHNLIIAGENDNDMMCAGRAVAEMGGGLAAAVDGKVIGRVPLPVAGLMSADPLEIVCNQMEELLSAVRGLGCRLEKPFMQLSFLALPVIPSLKLTDKGLVDVDAFKFISLFAD
ncbi:MAG: adenine deaminase, partial [Desulfobulbaceae bacterium]|nr:adenine deaminase [Desulfobulbaceae bacterium]